MKTQGPWFWRPLGVLCAGLSLALSSHGAPLQQFDVFIGFDKYVPEGNWFPVTCEVKNTGPGFNAVFELVASQFQEAQTVRMRLELPTGTQKRFVLPAFNGGRWNVTYNAFLYDDKGNRRAELRDLKTQEVVQHGRPLIAAICRTAAGMPVFPKVDERWRHMQPAVARLQTALVPDNPLTLECLAAIYLSTEKALELNTAQATALMAYVAGGGHLIVGVDQAGDLQGARWLAGLMPFVPAGMETVKNHQALQDWLVTTRTSLMGIDPIQRNALGLGAAYYAGFPELKPDPAFEKAALPLIQGKVREGWAPVECNGQPLLITAPRGRGQVTVLAFGPELEPARSWKNREHLWARLLELPPEWFQSDKKDRVHDYGGWGTDSAIGALVDSKQIRKLPVGWLVLLLLAYLAVIGPLDHFALKKINRQMLTWLTFPAYVFLFSLLIYFIGYKLRAGDTEWNELQVVDLQPPPQSYGAARPSDAGSALRGRSFASVYSPANASYPVESAATFAALRGEYGGTYQGRGGSRAVVEQRGNQFTGEVMVPVWTSQMYVGDWWQFAPSAPLAASARLVKEDWEIQVENRSNHKLTHVTAAAGDRVYELEDIPARTSRTLKVSRASGKQLRGVIQPLRNQLRNASGSRRRALGDSAATHITDVSRTAWATAFLETTNAEEQYDRFMAPKGYDLSRQLERGMMVLTAWQDQQAFVPALNRFNPRRARTDTFFRLVVPMQSATPQ